MPFDSRIRARIETAVRMVLAALLSRLCPAMLQGVFDQFLFPAPNPPSYSDERPGPWDNRDVVWLRTEKGGYQFPVVVCEPHGLLPQRVVLYCHGNACDVGQAYPSFRAEATRWRALVVLVEYPGYGQRYARVRLETHTPA